MRWFLRSLGALVILWAFFAASPYLALYDLAQAVERGDTDLLAQRVNFRALRASLVKDLIDRGRCGRAHHPGRAAVRHRRGG